MNKKLLVVAVAAALVAPLSAQAELKLSGTIQAEVGSVQVGDGDRVTISSDNDGALAGGGPNKIRLDFDEKLSAGLSAFGRVDWSFDTSNTNGATNLGDREHFLGLKGSNVHFKFGRIEGIYKGTGPGDVDPLYGTGVQGRAALGDGGFRENMTIIRPDSTTYDVMANGYIGGAGMSSGTAFSHSSFTNNVVELGFKTGGFSVIAQTTVDETEQEEGSVQLGIKYDASNWGVFLAGAYHDFDFGSATGSLTGDEEDDAQGNAKVGGWFKTGGLKLGLQYEMAEEGTLAYYKYTDANGDGVTAWDEADYVMGSASYQMGNVIIAGWVATYMSDWENEDALSFSLAAIYAFSKRTIAYAGYHDTNSDNNYRDWDVFAVGMRHSF